MDKKKKIIKEAGKYFLTPIKEHSGCCPSVKMTIEKTIELTIKEFALEEKDEVEK